MLQKPYVLIGIVVCVGGVATSLAIAEVQLRFAPPTHYPAGDAPNSVAVGDFDGDGHQDLAVANGGVWPTSIGDVSVLLGNGDGSFAPQTGYPAGDYPSSVAIGNFDGNGHQDLAVVNAYDVSVLLGNGDGSFTTPTHYAAGDNPQSLAIGDFDGDDHQDLAVANGGAWPTNGDVSVLLGNGDGSFAPQTGYPAGDYPSSVAIIDLYSDGHQDLAVVGYWPGYGDPWDEFWGEVNLLHGNGDGSFSFDYTYYYAEYEFLSSVAIGDFDSDGHQELAVTSRDSDNVLVLVLLVYAEETRYSAGDSPESVAIGDFNGDDHQDLAVANGGAWPTNGDVSVLLGNGDGSFAPQTRYPAGVGPSSVAIGDFDGDGRQDLAVAGGDVSVLLNRSYVPVQIDMRSNSINPYGRGVVPVAILGSDGFDVADIDVTTLRFGPDEAPTKHDLTDSFDYNEHLEDVNFDGYMDLMTHYMTWDTGIACGDTEATLSGQTLGGQYFEGTDTFETVGCNSNRPRRGMTSRDSERMQREHPPTNSEDQQHPGDLVEEQRVD